MKRVSFIAATSAALLCLCGGSISARSHKSSGAPEGKAKPVETVFLYSEKAPVTENGLAGGEKINEKGHIFNVGSAEASFDVYLPKKGHATGQMVIVCPGGGYKFLSSLHEGSYVAEWFTDRGIAAAVLKYRLPNGHCTVPTEDFELTMKYCREHSAKWGVNSIGVIGFSAGGHFASTVATHLKGETRPDFQILIYPVVTMEEGTHRGTHDLLIGKTPSQEAVDLYSNEKQVSPVTPPAFIAFSDDDKTVPPLANGLPMLKSLIETGVPATLFSVPKGGHGWGFPRNGEKDGLSPKDRTAFYSALESWLKTL